MFGQSMFREDFTPQANAINQALFEDKQGQLEAEVERLRWVGRGTGPGGGPWGVWARGQASPSLCRSILPRPSTYPAPQTPHAACLSPAAPPLPSACRSQLIENLEFQWPLSLISDSSWQGLPEQRMGIINLAAIIDMRIRKMYEVTGEGAGGTGSTGSTGRARAPRRAAAGRAAAAGLHTAGPLRQGAGVPPGRSWPGPVPPLGRRQPHLLCTYHAPSPARPPSMHAPPTHPHTHTQVIECDIAPQVASRGVGIAPYKGKHATGSGGEAAAEVYRQAAVLDGAAGTSGAGLPEESGACAGALPPGAPMGCAQAGMPGRRVGCC